MIVYYYLITLLLVGVWVQRYAMAIPADWAEARRAAIALGVDDWWNAAERRIVDVFKHFG